MDLDLRRVKELAKETTKATEDIQAHYDERIPVRGIKAMMASMRTFKRMEAGEMKTTTHFMGNLNFIRLENDTAETETNAIAFLVRPGQGAGQIAMRSLRYLDKLRRTDDGWRICERQHTLDWSCEMPATFAVTLAQRVMRRAEPSAAST